MKTVNTILAASMVSVLIGCHSNDTIETINVEGLTDFNVLVTHTQTSTPPETFIDDVGVSTTYTNNYIGVVEFNDTTDAHGYRQTVVVTDGGDRVTNIINIFTYSLSGTLLDVVSYSNNVATVCTVDQATPMPTAIPRDDSTTTFLKLLCNNGLIVQYTYAGKLNDDDSFTISMIKTTLNPQTNVVHTVSEFRNKFNSGYSVKNMYMNINGSAFFLRQVAKAL